MFIKFGRSFLLALTAVGGVAFFAPWGMSLVRAADNCCKCTLPADPQKNICLKTQITDCAKLSTESKYPAVKALNCTTTDPICKPVAQSGTCAVGPVEENHYSLPKDAKTGSSAAAKDDANKEPVTPPTLNIDIPGLTFSQTATVKDGKLQIPFLAEYVSAIYSYLMVIGALVAAAMIVYGGFRYIVGGTVGDVQSGRAIILDAVFGLFLIISANLILRTINPALVSFEGLKVKAVVPEEFRFMSRPEVGFKDAKAAQINEDKAFQVAGRGPLVEEYAGEHVSIDGIVEDGDKASQRLNAYCTKREDREKLKTYDEKIQTLVRAVLGFNKICIKENSCAYVRGGGTDLASGKVGAGAADIPFLMSKLDGWNIRWNWPLYCGVRWEEGETVTIAPANGNDFLKALPKTTYDSIDCQVDGKGILASLPCKIKLKPFKQIFYQARSHPLLVDFEYGENKPCYTPLFTRYDENLAQGMSNQGFVGGDCGTTLGQMLTCAGGKVGRPTNQSETSVFNYINYGKYIDYLDPDQGAPGPDFPVWRAKDIVDLDAQWTKNGGPKFGDILVVGSGGGQHNFMFTGGRADVPFEIIEMGSPSTVSTKGKALVKFPDGNSALVFGMGTHPPGDLYPYLTGQTRFNATGLSAKNWFPATVARPYVFEPCESNEQCAMGEVCLCTAKDPLRANTKRICTDPADPKSCKVTVERKCSMQNICRNPRKNSTEPLFCQNDTNCPRGEICIRNNEMRKQNCPDGKCSLNFCYKVSGE